MKKNLLILFVALQFSNAFSQRDPSREILVFFNQGIAREAKVINGQTVLQPRIKSSRLKSDLLSLGINELTLEIANPKFNEEDTIKILQDGTILQQLNMTRLFRFKVPEGKSRTELIKALNKLPEVLYAEANGTVAPFAIPSDTRFNEQWGIRNTVNPGADIHAEAAWDIYTGNPNNIIGIIDGGTDVNHVDLNDKISGGDTGFGWDGHGIHVSGIAAAESNNAQGVSGVDWNARIHAQRIDNADDVDTYNAIVDAVNFSPNLQVLNNSWGMRNTDGSPGRYSITVRQAFAYAYKANRTSVVAMGNDQVDFPNVVSYPAGFDNVIAVGASNINDVIANFSSRGAHIDVSAPGVNILSTFNGGGYGNLDGTSMATPHVAGIASLLKGLNPDLSNDDIENILRLSADDLNNPPVFIDGTGPGFDQSSGAGRVNAERALNFFGAPFAFHQWTTSSGTDFGTTSNYINQFLSAPGLASGYYVVKRHEVRKTVTFPISFCQITGVWGRGVSTSGWRTGNPNYGEGFCEVVPGTLTSTGATLRTYLYEVYTMLGQYVGYFPTSPGNATFAYTVLGVENPNSFITGPSVFCTSGQFSLQTVPLGSTVSWTSTSSNALQINSATGLATGVGGFNGSVDVIATYNNGACNGISFNKTVWIGPPSGLIDGPWEVYPDQVYLYSANSLGLPYNFTWSISGSGYNWGGSDTQPHVFVFWTSSGSSGSVGLESSNGCGTTYSSLDVTITAPGGGGCDPCQRVRPHPIPAKGTLNLDFDVGLARSRRIDLRNLNNPSVGNDWFESNSMKNAITGKLSSASLSKLDQDAPLTNGDIEYTLYNEKGTMVYQGVTQSLKSSIDISHLDKGVYVLNVRYGRVIEKQKIIIGDR